MDALERRLAALEAKLLDRSDRLSERLSHSLARLEERIDDEILPSIVNPLDRLGESEPSDTGCALKELADMLVIANTHFERMHSSISSFRQGLPR